jgi:hypothetical protein
MTHVTVSQLAYDTVTNGTVVQQANDTLVLLRMVHWSCWRLLQGSSDEWYSGPAGE